MSESLPARTRRSTAELADLTRQPVQVDRLKERVIAEGTVPHNGRMGRSDAMLALLKATLNHTEAADRFRRHFSNALASTALNLDGADMTQLLTHECQAAFFRKLRARGYDEKTTWDELVSLLPGVCAEAQEAARVTVTETEMDADAVLWAKALRLAAGAETFLQAARPVMAFLEDTTEATPDADPA